jgi:hypothetical protein
MQYLDQRISKTMSGRLHPTNKSICCSVQWTIPQSASSSLIFHNFHNLNRQPFFHMYIYLWNYKSHAWYLWWVEDLVQSHHVSCDSPLCCLSRISLVSTCIPTHLGLVNWQVETKHMRLQKHSNCTNPSIIASPRGHGTRLWYHFCACLLNSMCIVLIHTCDIRV